MNDSTDRTESRYSTRKLKKITEHKWIGGVCAGVAYWLGIQPWIARLVWTCIALIYGVGIILYILFWIFMPKWQTTPEDYSHKTGD